MSLHIYQNPESLADGLASWLVGHINTVLRRQNRFSFVLSGGSTPKLLYQKLAADYAIAADWDRVDFFYGDERFVPKDDDRSNAKMASALLLQPLGIKEDRVFAIPTENSTDASVLAYQQTLEDYFHADDVFSFDFVLLGMGTDAHTLSLFPGNPVPESKQDFVAHTFNKSDNTDRITLLPSVVNYAKAIAFMVQGSDKAETLRHVLYGEHNMQRYPSQLIKPASGQLLWFADIAASGKIVS